MMDAIGTFGGFEQEFSVSMEEGKSARMSSFTVLGTTPYINVCSTAQLGGVIDPLIWIIRFQNN
jgi:hypothetical protein